MGKKPSPTPPLAPVTASAPSAARGPAAKPADSSPPPGDFDLDALFSAGKKVKARTDAKRAAEAAEAEAARPPKEKDRVLLPGQKKKKRKRDAPEFVPVNAPRRFEDGLPVYKSYDDFSDISCGQAPPASEKGKPKGKCPFDCWCCF